MTNKIRIVCATRERAADFYSNTALGRSLGIYAPYENIELQLFDSNTRGLPAIYNVALRGAAQDPATLLFVHDDITLCDFFWPLRVSSALQAFDLVGLAGNKRRVPGQTAWCFLDDRFTTDEPGNLSGIVGHGKGFPPSPLSFFGFPGQEVKLLDGLFLAARSETLLAKEIFFDERFDFHFYDLDLCRQMEMHGLRMGTCTISVIHESSGNFDTPAWRAGLQKYRDKWKS